jgi:hypothetical protein
MIKKIQEIVESIKNKGDFLEGENLKLENKLKAVEHKMNVERL